MVEYRQVKRNKGDNNMDDKGLISQTRYCVQVYTGFKWENEGKSTTDYKEAKRIQRKARSMTGCKTRIFVFETNVEKEI